MAILSLEYLRRLAAEYELLACALKRLEDTQMYHLLRSSSISNGSKISNMLSGMSPENKRQYVKWMSVCDGGLLYETTLLSLNAYDPQLDMDFDDLESNNTLQAYRELSLPEKGYFVIGMRSYGDPICLGMNDGKVYLYNLEEDDFTEIWDTFFDFLADETDEYMELLADGELDPIPLKLQGDDDAE